MQTLLQISNKEDLIDELETTITEFCEEVVGLELAELLRTDLEQITEQLLENHGTDGKKMTSIEGTYYFHIIFSTSMPDLYSMWYESEMENFDNENFFVENKNTAEALKKATTTYHNWGLELIEPLLVQELKRALQYRLFSMRTDLTDKLLTDLDVIHIQPAKDNVVSNELLTILDELAEIETKFDSLLSKIDSVSLTAVD